MHEGKEREALAYVLRVTLVLLKSDGDRFNELLEMVGEAKAGELKEWLKNSRKKYV